MKITKRVIYNFNIFIYYNEYKIDYSCDSVKSIRVFFIIRNYDNEKNNFTTNVNTLSNPSL